MLRARAFRVVLLPVGAMILANTLMLACKARRAQDSNVKDDEGEQADVLGDVTAPASDYAASCGTPTLLASLGPTDSSGIEGLGGQGQEQSAFALADDTAGLGPKVKAIFNDNCTYCHKASAPATRRGPIADLMDRQQMASYIAGQPEQTKLFRSIATGKMPKTGDPLNDQDQATVKAWLAAGAPGMNGGAGQPAENPTTTPTDSGSVTPPPSEPPSTIGFINRNDMYGCIKADLEKIAPKHRPYARYYSLTHLHNAGVPTSEIKLYEEGLSKLLNSLSWHKRVTRPLAIDPAKTIFRIDLRVYQWSTEQWEKQVSAYPYFVEYGDPAEKAIQAMIQGTVPYLRADWFIATASIPPLYHEVLKVPETDKELEGMLDVDVKKNWAEQLVVRAGFNNSGVSQSNRLIERHDSSYGAYWKSYDFAKSNGNGNLFANPLGPVGAFGSTKEFVQAGGEIIFNLPNGLQGYMLTDGVGKRIDKGPIAIVSHPARPDRIVINGLSCFDCHNKGMVRKDDQVGPAVAGNAGFTQQEKDLIAATYRDNAKLNERFTEDEQRFRTAVEATGAKTTYQSEPVFALASRYDAEISAEQFAAELGIPKTEFITKLQATPSVSQLFGQLAVAGGTAKRQAFETEYSTVVRDLGLGQVVDVQLRKEIQEVLPCVIPKLTEADVEAEFEKATTYRTDTSKYFMNWIPAPYTIVDLDSDRPIAFQVGSKDDLASKSAMRDITLQGYRDEMKKFRQCPSDITAKLKSFAERGPPKGFKCYDYPSFGRGDVVKSYKDSKFNDVVLRLAIKRVLKDGTELAAPKQYTTTQDRTSNSQLESDTGVEDWVMRDATKDRNFYAHRFCSQM